MIKGESVGVVGSGLIGGSLALRLQAKGRAVKVWDAARSVLNAAEVAGLTVANSLADCATAVETLVIATPPSTVVDIADQVLEIVDTKTVVTDIASVKVPMTGLITAYRDRQRRYIPSHPMAGKAVRGFRQADANLFEGCTWVICAAAPDALCVSSLADDLGARRVVCRTPQQHDRQVAAISHVPQLVVTAIAASLEIDDLWAINGKSPLQESLRLARSPAEMWTQIAEANFAEIDEAISWIIGMLASVSSGGVREAPDVESLLATMSTALFDLAEQRERSDPGTLELAGPGFRASTKARRPTGSYSPEAASKVRDILTTLRSALPDHDRLAELFTSANVTGNAVQQDGFTGNSSQP